MMAPLPGLWGAWPGWPLWIRQWVSNCDDAQRNPWLSQNKIGNLTVTVSFLQDSGLGSAWVRVGLAQPETRYGSVRLGTLCFAWLDSKLSCLGSKLGSAWLGDSFG